ncbi:NAD kinase [Parvularcula sp. LCG005]|uniref:NAD kinase n=1 Tax=Parvularcula sp. LCG005 TaxID=3078805 RepID=UPI002942F967|nr:NAD kinase [Parvularcula sp. LCG005]WOI54137.1 NAD kinase [Parvularcula sp. LCG005]
MSDKRATEKLHFAASDRPKAQEARAELVKRYGDVDRDEADVIVALGGDGTLLEVLRHTMPDPKPIYGMNCGTVGFLMNEHRLSDLRDRIAVAGPVVINPLRMNATDSSGQSHEAMAFNEVALLRETRQTARIKIRVNGQVQMDQLICDGILLATPAGSTAYNLSAHGPILPITSNLLALTPISPFRPRRWRGALLPYEAAVEFEVQDADFRTVAATADNIEIRDVERVKVAIADDIELCLLFDQGAGLEERILEEQFQY